MKQKADSAPGDETLERMMLRSTKRSPYFGKDHAKARRATQFIGQGSPASSTAAYAVAMAAKANTGKYIPEDVVFVSSEGLRRGRFAPFVDGEPRGAYVHIRVAIAAGARFIVDAPADRARHYNQGEREVEDFLIRSGYGEMEPGLFAPIRPPFADC